MQQSLEKLLLKLKELDINIKIVDGNLKITVPDDFDNPDIISELKENKQLIISFLQNADQSKGITAEIPKAVDKEYYPLSSSQLRLFLLNQINHSLAYNQTGVLKIDGAVSYEKLTHVFKSLIERHECFRMAFSLDEYNKPQLKVMSDIHFEIEHLKMEVDMETLIHNFIKTFDLNNPPLIRVGVAQVDDSHFILIDMHHIASDGVSLQIIMKEFSQLYKGIKLPELKRQYKDYSEWLSGSEYQSAVQKQKEFWINEFDIDYSPLALPSDFPRPKEKTFEGRVAKFKMSDEEKLALNEISKIHNTTLYTVLLGVYGILLSKLSGNTDIVIGTLVAGRKHDELEGIVGMFAKTLALPISLDADLSFNVYLQQLHQRLLNCLDNDDYPYEELINELRIERDRSRNPLFDCLFVLQNIRQESFEIEDANIERFQFESRTAKFDLTLEASEDLSGLSFDLEYSTDLFKYETIERFIGFYKTLLQQVIENHQVPLSALSLLSKEGEQDLLKLNNVYNVSYPTGVTVVDLFEKQVKKRPDAIAVVYEGASLTYSELNRLSNVLAYELRSQGIGRDDIVGLFTDKNLYTVVGMLGILKSGGCYLPLDPAYPEGRIHYMLENSKLSVLVTDTKHESTIPDGIKKILLEKITSVTDSVVNIEPVNEPGDLCYIIYTSGTTGNPKGVMITHENVVRLLYNDGFQFSFGENDVWTMFHSHCFDFSVWEMYGALLYGGKVIIVPELVSRDPSRYIQLLKRHKVTVLNQTPTSFNNLIEEVGRKDIELNDLRYVIFGGEALVPSKLKSWHQKYPGVTLVNMYGITEVTVHATYVEIGEKEIGDNLSVIGKPIPTTSIYVLDANQKLVPQGITGEIYIGGAGISRGYLNNGELTATRFFENPYRKGERYYRSGDLGRLLANGDLEYLGRIDDQVQLKGFRIELKEIEHQLLRHASISNAVVIKRDSDEGHPYLCAYYIGEETLEVSALRAHLGEYLPVYMIPAYFVKLEEFPSTVNNKIAVSKLPAPDKELSGGNYVAPATEEEALMAKIWEEVLGVSPIGIRDNYFSLGGDSLKAIGLIFNINNKLSTSLTIADLYSYQTIEELNVMVTASKKDDRSKQAFAEARKELDQFQQAYKLEHGFPDSYEEVYPMNGVEKGMVFEYLKTAPENIHEIIYHEQNMYDYPVKDFDFALFEHAVDLMIEKHPALRKVYDLECFAHIIKKKITPEVNFIDIRHLDKKEQKFFIKNKLMEEKMRMTSMAFSLLWRINIIKIRDDYQYLLFDFHHSLFDGWSLSSFLTELLNMYSTLSSDKNFIPKRLQSTYEDQILGELAAAKNEVSIQYWKEEMDGYTRFELPSTGTEHKFITDVFELGVAYRDELEELAVRYNTSFKHLCFAAYIYTLNMLSYDDDITIGMVTNNRPLTPDGDRLLGCFLNTIPFRAKIPEGLTWGGYIEFIENKLRKLKYHERVPFHKILEIIEEPSSEKNPVFDVAFNYLDFKIFEEWNAYDSTIELEENSLSEFFLNEHFPFGFHIEAHDLRQEHGGVYNRSFRLLLRYSTAVFSKSQTKKMADYFKAILDQFLYSETAPISKDKIMMLEEEDYGLLKQFNATEVKYESTGTVLDLFSEQVQRNPEKIAVVLETDKLSYRELDNISNQLSHLLIETGVVSDSLVPICVDQSLEMIIGILGILKAGGAYVPIDPKYPQNRINYVLEDTKPIVVLTSRNHQYLFDEVASVNLDDKSIFAHWPVSPADITIPEESLAYVIYTSGTTGMPKGVMNQHDGIYNRLLWMQNYLNVTEADVILQKTTFCFDVSVWELLLPIICGAKLVFIVPDGQKDPNYLWNLIRTSHISITHFVPSMLSAFLSNLKVVESHSLRAVISSGEELKLAVLKDFKAVFPEVELHNLYGPTEAAIDVTAVNLCTDEESVTIGKPVANTQIHIIDRKNNIQPVGVCGELLIGGIQVARGYLNKAELTSQKFIDNPFDKKDNYKLYKTGDIGRWLLDGSIELLGRIDDQIKIRGFRVELGEIQAQLLNHPKVKESIILYKQNNGNNYLVGYYVSDVELSTLELKNYLRRNLPDYMVPLIYLRLDEVPLTTNGKLNKASLPIPEIMLENRFVAPSNHMEATLVSIWAEALSLEKEKISVNSNFFDLGGNSLSAVLLVNKMNQAFEMDITFRTFFKNPYIQGIASFILSNKKESINEV